MQERIQQAIQLQQAGRAADSEQLLIGVLQADHRHADAWHYRGVAAHLGGRNYDAVAFIERSLVLQPDNSGAWYNLAVVFGELGDSEAAEAAYRRTIGLQAEHVSARHNLANLLKQQGRYGEAVAVLKPDAGLLDDSSRYLANLAHAYKMSGRSGDAVETYRAAMAAAPDDARLHSQYLFALQYHPEIEYDDLIAEHRRWNELHAPAGGAVAESVKRDGGPLRVGFVSPDLGNHPVGIFLIPLLRRLDRDRFQTVCYSDHQRADEYNAQLRPLAGAWHDVWKLNDEQLAEQIRRDQIDILFDLAGHTDENRMSLFARRAAPIQITWAGYVGTTGLAAMDYLLCDRFHVPPDVEWQGSEKPLRMPNGYICYEAPSYAPDVADLPALSSGYVTFGSMSNVCKINEPLIEIWAEILRSVSNSKLLLKYKGFEDPCVQTFIRDAFSRRDVSAERILLQGNTTHVEHLKTHHRVDIMLDPIPYSSGLTTCESLWMGVPVVTCPGERFASRHALSHMSNAGLTETIAENRDDYVKIAVELANDLPGLQTLRRDLRQRMASSPLCDLEQYAVDFSEMLLSVTAQ